MRRLFLVLCATALGGCASFSGAPRPVISTAQAQLLIANFNPDSVVAHMAGLGEGERTSYRNRVVASYLMAADARYEEFRRSLSKSIKGGNLAFDAAGLGLTGLASAWRKAATDLAAGATALAGGRSSISRELYFEKTLPTLLSLMESERLSVRADILKGMAQSENDYSMHEAFADLWRYQAAASIDGAIQQAAEDAAEKAAEKTAQAKIDFGKAVKLCRPPADLAERRQKLQFALEAQADAALAANAADGAVAARTRIQKAAAAAGFTDAALTTDSDSTDAQLGQIADYLLTVCSAETLNAFEAKIKEAGVTVQ